MSISSNPVTATNKNDTLKVFVSYNQNVLPKRSHLDTLGRYLSEIAKYRVLTRTEERELITSIRLGEQYRSIRQEHGIAQSDMLGWSRILGISETTLRERLQQSDQARESMVRHNLKLVVAIAKRYSDRNMPMLDLIQEGSLGLIRAIEDFDPSKGYKFSTYAFNWIRQAMTRAIAEKSRTIRLPCHITEKLNRLKKIRSALAQELGRFPTQAEQADRYRQKYDAKFTEAKLRNLLEQVRCTLSMNVPLSQTDEIDSVGYTLEHLVSDPNTDLSLSAVEDRFFLDDLMARLPTRERISLEARFGYGFPPMTQRAIAKKIKTHHNNVSALQKRSIQRIRNTVSFI